jgi:3-isopropylmalate/(R)-2-methylmalate dehydratase large subunit
MPAGVYAKDVALHVLRKLGARAGVGYAYEFGGPVVQGFSMDERMTLCNLAVEGGARCGYVNPDSTTFEYLRGREYAPDDAEFADAVRHWQSFRSDDDAHYDDVVVLDISGISPIVTWGISPDQSVFVEETLPETSLAAGMEASSFDAVLEFMDLRRGTLLAGTRIDVAFIGSCTNGRLSDFEAVVRLLRGRTLRIAPHVRALIVPGSMSVRDALIARGWDKVFIDAGFELRDSGCSLCCGMNDDKLTGREVCASSSNRNFKGRQGSPEGRTFLMSPVMVAAAAIAGEVIDARALFQIADRRIGETHSCSGAGGAR